jgi:hypothetical protein
MTDDKINVKATLSAIRERQEKLEKIKEKNKQFTANINNNLLIGTPLIYNIMKKQNQKLLDDVEKVFQSKLPFNSDLKKEFIKPPYLTPKIVSHKLTKILNQT